MQALGRRAEGIGLSLLLSLGFGLVVFRCGAERMGLGALAPKLWGKNSHRTETRRTSRLIWALFRTFLPRRAAFDVPFRTIAFRHRLEFLGPGSPQH